MNLAFPALCLLLLVLPGILFRKAYARGAVLWGSPKTGGFAINKHPTSKLPLTEEIAVSLINAIVLQIIWLSLCTWLSDFFKWLDRFAWFQSAYRCPWLHWLPLSFKPDYKQLLYVIYGGLAPGDGHYEETLGFLARHHTSIAVYFLTLYAASGFAGRGALWFVRHFQLDHKWMFLRLEDQWFYFLYGEIFGFQEFRRFLSGPPAITGTYVSVVVAHGEADVLYKGFLWDFYLDSHGNLDRLLLHNVIRCKFYPSGTQESAGNTRPPTGEAGGTRSNQPILGRLLRPGKSQHDESSASVEGEVPADRILIRSRNWAFERISSQIFTVKYADCKTLACTYFSIKKRNSSPKQGTAATAAKEPSGAS